MAEVTTDTTHMIRVWGNNDDGQELELFVDSDRLVQLRICQCGDEPNESRWWDKDDLLRVRAAINRALRLL